MAKLFFMRKNPNDQVRDQIQQEFKKFKPQTHHTVERVIEQAVHVPPPALPDSFFGIEEDMYIPPLAANEVSLSAVTTENSDATEATENATKLKGKVRNKKKNEPEITEG